MEVKNYVYNANYEILRVPSLDLDLNNLSIKNIENDKSNYLD
jgi:hypothetical protein